MMRRMARASLVALTLGGSAAAQDTVREVPVTIDADGAPAVLGGSFGGYDSVLFTFDAAAGDRLVASLPPETGASMTLYAPGTGPGDAALASGDRTLPEVNHFDLILPATGRYGIAVWQMRAPARRGETVEFRLDLALGPPEARREPTTETVAVRFASGRSDATESGRLGPGDAVDYVLGASAGQTMTVTFGGDPDGIHVNVLDPSGGLVFDSTTTDRGFWQGVLRQGGDQVVTVYNTGAASAGYVVSIGIE